MDISNIRKTPGTQGGSAPSGGRGRGSPLLTYQPDRSIALERWAAWINKLINDHYNGKHMDLCRDVYGLSATGAVNCGSQARKWREVENNSLPSDSLIAPILAKASKLYGRPINIEVVAKNTIPYVPPNLPKSPNMKGAKTRKASKANGKDKTKPLFKVDTVIPQPDIAFKSSLDHEGYYDFEVKAVLPMSGVLAVMAMLEDSR